MFSAISIHHHNIGMWLDFQKSLREVIDSAWAYFLASNPAKFRQAEIIERYISDIENQKPDILFLTEVCGVFQRDLIADKLETLGYKVDIVEAFELWNMPDQESAYLYNIIGTKDSLEHRKTVKQYRNNTLIRFLKWKNGLGRKQEGFNDRTRAILDGAWSHYKIGGLNIGVMHVHWLGQDTNRWVLRNVAISLPRDNTRNILFWDLNLPVWVSQAVVSENYWSRGMNLLDTERTYPFFAEKDAWILAKVIRRMGTRFSYSHPDQFFYDREWFLTPSNQVVLPSLWWIPSDHAQLRVSIAPRSQG